MKKIMVAIILMACVLSISSYATTFVTPQQPSVNIRLGNWLKGLSLDQKNNAIVQQQASRNEDVLAMRKRLYNARRAQFVQSLNANNKLTPKQRDAALKKFDETYAAQTNSREEKFGETVDFINKISADKTMTQAQKKKAIAEYFKVQKNQNATFSSTPSASSTPKGQPATQQ